MCLKVFKPGLGVPAADRPRFHQWSERILSGSPGIGAIRLLPAVRSLLRYLRELFAERRAEPRDDLITALVHAEEAGDRPVSTAARASDPWTRPGALAQRVRRRPALRSPSVHSTLYIPSG